MMRMFLKRNTWPFAALSLVLLIQPHALRAAAWDVEPGSVGNALVLNVNNICAQSLHGVTVKVEDAPDWVRFKSKEVTLSRAVEPQETEKVRFLFDVSESVPLGTEGTLELLVKGVEGSWTKEILLAVVPATALPKASALHQNSPNPSHGSTVIRYQLPAPTHATMRVYNLTGCAVRTLANEKKTAGYYEAMWDGEDEGGNILPNGIYFYRLEAGHYTLTRKMVLLR